MSATIPSGINFHFEPDDADTATEIKRIIERLEPFVAERWGLATPQSLDIYVVDTWQRLLYEDQSWFTRLLNLALRPYHWYWLSFHHGWRDVVWCAFTDGQKRAFIRMKSLRHASLGPSVQLYASWDDRSRVPRDGPSIWREGLVTSFVRVCSGRIAGNWVVIGISAVANEQLFGSDGSQPRFALVREWVGLPERGIKRTRLDRLVQSEIDEHIGRSRWPYWIVRYLDETRPSTLREVLASRCQVNEIDARIAASLQIPPGALWDELRRAAGAYFDGAALPARAAAHTADMAAVPPAAPDNPYRPPIVEIAAPPKKTPPAPAQPTKWRVQIGGWILLALMSLALLLLANRTQYVAFPRFTAWICAGLIIAPIALIAVQFVIVGAWVVWDLVRGKRGDLE